MSLQDMIREQSAAEVKEAERHAELKKQFDEQFEAITNQAISQEAKKLYNCICQDILRQIKESSTVNGSFILSPYIVLELPFDLRQYIGQECNLYLNNRSKIRDGSSIFEHLSVIHDTDANDNIIDTIGEVSLCLFHEKATRVSEFTGVHYRTYTESPFWSQYWDCLTKLSASDRVSLEFSIELKKQGFLASTWSHHSYVSFGKKINCAKYKSTPVIRFSYTK